MASAAVVSLLFSAARLLFFGYLERRFGFYSLVYGWLATAVILMLWAWTVALITLFGATLTRHIEELLLEGRSAEERRPGERSRRR